MGDENGCQVGVGMGMGIAFENENGYGYLILKPVLWVSKKIGYTVLD